ncbi:MAG: hypothetical protein FRX49_04666 [Trebouxia sp. A1-2]|nr:MAG: hypothetical protein FRX49_04666 [Trebouxia sp. A1-2]
MFGEDEYKQYLNRVKAAVMWGRPRRLIQRRERALSSLRAPAPLPSSLRNSREDSSLGSCSLSTPAFVPRPAPAQTENLSALKTAARSSSPMGGFHSNPHLSPEGGGPQGKQRNYSSEVGEACAVFPTELGDKQVADFGSAAKKPEHHDTLLELLEMVDNSARKPLQLFLEDVLTHLGAQQPHHLHRLIMPYGHSQQRVRVLSARDTVAHQDRADVKLILAQEAAKEEVVQVACQAFHQPRISRGPRPHQHPKPLLSHCIRYG